MRAKLAALALLLGALSLETFVRRPLEGRLDDARAEYERLRSRRVARGAPRARHEVSSRDPVSELRRVVVSCLEKSPLVDVQLEVRPAAAPLGASARIAGQGSFEEDLRLVGAIVRPGLLLGHVRLSPASPVVHLEMEVLSLRNP